MVSTYSHEEHKQYRLRKHILRLERKLEKLVNGVNNCKSSSREGNYNSDHKLNYSFALIIV